MRRQPVKGRGAEIFLGSPPEKGGDQLTVTPDDQTTVAPVQQHAGKPSNQTAVFAGDQYTSELLETPNEEAEELVKATFYLAPEVVDDLDDFWFHLRKKTRRRARISKSQIVSHALGQTIRSLKNEPPEKLIEFFK